MPFMWLSSSNGPDFAVYSPGSQGITPSLKEQAQRIGRLFSSLIERLTSQDESLVGNVRLQDVFAAGCEGCSVEEWKGLTEEEREEKRTAYSKVFRNFSMAPSLVICLGSNLDASGRRRIAASPSMDYQWYNVPPPDGEHSEWDDCWEAARDSTEFPWDWGWTHRHHGHFDGHPLIFLSGFFVLWDSIWGKRLFSKFGGGSLEYSQQRAIVDAFLQITLFHELIHVARTRLHGTQSTTPEKCVDDPRYIQVTQRGRTSGEAGRMGEKLAFGRPVNFYMTPENLCHLYYFDDERDTREVDDDTRACFFNIRYRSPPLLDQSKGGALKLGPKLFIPEAARFKAQSHREDVDEGEQVKSITCATEFGLPLVEEEKKSDILWDLMGDPERFAKATTPRRCIQD
ncbi:hypothetical protein V5O48_011561 [Marasmius crinis-equi]|uniref:Uncharacterized protein n=1 Tax=Marasmius crinis-equi TaxID=585013 RepID=A0ABR3F590_9AGAR